MTIFWVLYSPNGTTNIINKWNTFQIIHEYIYSPLFDWNNLHLHFRINGFSLNSFYGIFCLFKNVNVDMLEDKQRKGLGCLLFRVSKCVLSYCRHYYVYSHHFDKWRSVISFVASYSCRRVVARINLDSFPASNLDEGGIVWCTAFVTLLDYNLI